MDAFELDPKIYDDSDMQVWQLFWFYNVESNVYLEM